MANSTPPLGANEVWASPYSPPWFSTTSASSEDIDTSSSTSSDSMLPSPVLSPSHASSSSSLSSLSPSPLPAPFSVASIEEAGFLLMLVQRLSEIVSKDWKTHTTAAWNGDGVDRAATAAGDIGCEAKVCHVSTPYFINANIVLH